MKRFYSYITLVIALTIVSHNAISRDLFWIGTTSAWADGSNWSDTKNGSAINTIPTAADNVFLTTVNSKVTVIEFKNADCQNFTILNNGQLLLRGSVNSLLRIGGDIQITNNTKIINEGTIELNAVKNISYEISPSLFVSALKINNKGKAIFKSDLKIEGKISHYSGELIAKANSISCESYEFVTPQHKSVQLDKGNLFVNNKTLNPGDAIYIDFSKIIVQNPLTSNLTSSGGTKKGGGGNGNKQATQVFTTVTPPTCNGLSDGQATVDSIRTTPGSTGPFVYTWSRAGFPTVTGVTATGLSNGTYLLRVLDQGDNTTLGVFVNVLEPDPIFSNITKTNETCFGACDGTASAFPIGGTPITPGSTYNYAWSTSATTASITGLCVGTYTVTITDGNGCTNVDNVTVGGPSAVSPNVTSVNIACKGDNNGSATAAPTGGVGPYSFLWSDAGASTSAGLVGLSPGTYTVTVTDNTACTGTQSVTITEPATLLSASITVNSPVTCAGNTDGIITANGIGGNGPYTYLWSNTSTQKTLLNIAAGTYTVTVTDANNCTKIDQVTLNSPTPVVPVASVVSDVSCFGFSDGEATVTSSGGTPGYTYVWSNTATTPTISGLVAGTYTVTATDAINCQAITQITISEPTLLSTAIINSSGSTCFGGANGSAEASPTGGTAPYSFAWSNSANTAVISGLSAGTYTVTVTDLNLCTSSAQITIAQGTQILPNVVTTNIQCRGDNNGTATSSPTGGVGPYTFLWSDAGASTTPSISGLAAGTYTVTVTDGNSCTDTETISITEPATGVNASINILNNLSCNGNNDAVIQATGTGGTPGYTYLWSNTSTSRTQLNIGPGTYTVTITDANLCTATDVVTLTYPSPIVPIAVVDADVSCFGFTDGQATVSATGGTPGYSFNWSNSQTTATITGLAAGTYTVTVTDINNCDAITQVTIAEPTLLIGTILNQSDAVCFNGTDGSIEADGLGGTPPYSFLWSNAATTGLNAGLTAGTYTVTITDNNNCTAVTQATVGQGAQITATSNVLSNPLCNGGNQGAGEVIVTGGAPGYSYLWSNAATTPIITGLLAGTYTVTVSDLNLCTETAQFTLTEPTAILTTITTTNNPQCAGLSAASATVSPSGGTPGYTFIWSNAATTPTISSLTAGTYTVTVSDANNCTAIDQVTINQSPVITTAVTSTDVDCFGNSTGTANVVAGGGAGGFSFAWSNSGTTASISNLSAGKYFITVTDLNGCTALDSAEIQEPTLLTTIASKTDASCDVSADGSGTVVASGGTPNYTFLWTGGLTTSTINNLNPGKYFVTVTDLNNCTTIDSVEILQTNPVILSVDSTLNVNCNGGIDGGAYITTSGGTAPYTYLWNNAQTSDTLKNVTAGTYTLIVTDANTCTDQISVTVTEPLPLTSSIAGSNVNCFGGSDGQAFVTATGGTAPYTYLWSTAATTDTIKNLTVGKYLVTITDFNNCIKVDSITLTEPLQIQVTVSTTDALCKDSANGTITAVAINGVAPYTFSWSNSGTGGSLTGLIAGTYTVTVTDFNGCTSVNSGIVAEPTAITSSVLTTDASCSGFADGIVNLTVSGGTPNYTFIWSNTSTTQNLTAVAAGKYFVTITDLNGCIKVDSATVNDGITINASLDSISNIDCNGGNNGFIRVLGIGGTNPYTYSWSNSATTNAISGLVAGSYTVTITDLNGCFKDTTINISEPNAIVTSVTSIDVSCFGGNDGEAFVTVNGGITPYTYLWSNTVTSDTIKNLTAGKYIVTITDANNCIKLDSVTITEPFQIQVTIATTDALCKDSANGTANATAINGTAPYTFAWSNSNTGSNISGLLAGTYTVTVTDLNGCTSVNTGVVAEPTAITSSTTATDASCSGIPDGSITLTVAGGSPNYAFLWSNSVTTQNQAAVGSGKYFVTITDLNGCIKIDSATVNDGVSINTLVDSIANVDCNGGNNGFIRVAGLGGSSPYSYLWSTSATTDAIGGLTAGAYTVTITDLNGCFKDTTINITEPLLLTVSTATTNISCNGNADGTATASGSGGTAPYAFNWSTTQTGPSITGLSAGSYTVTVTDNNGCTATDNFTIIPQSSFTYIDTITNNNCFGDCNGELGIFALSGGTPPYSFNWSNSATTSLINGLCAGTYTLTISDANNCDSIVTYTITEPTQLITTTTTTNSNCTVCDGIAVATVSGGTPTYSYNWLDASLTPIGQTTDTARGLCSGVYNVEITDFNGCRDTVTANIIDNNAPVVSTSSTDVTCFGANDGTATVNSPCLLTTCSVNWLSITGTPIGQTTTTAIGLNAGIYIAEVSDVSGCVSLDTVTINSPTQIIPNDGIVPVSCSAITLCDGSAFVKPTGGSSPYTYLWTGNPTGQGTDSISGLCVGAYTVTITDNNNCDTAVTINVSQGGNYNAIINVTDETCANSCDGTAEVILSGITAPPHTYLWSPVPPGGQQGNRVLSGLCTGNYSVTVTDLAGCTTTASTTIGSQNSLVANESFTNETCGGTCDGTATVNPVGGTGPYIFTWTPTPSVGQGTNTASGLCPGPIEVLIADINGCDTIIRFNISSSTPILPNETVTDATCNGNCDGLITLAPTGGSSSIYTYTWTPVPPNGQGTATASGLCAGNYSVLISDGVGCDTTLTITINESSAIISGISSIDASCNSVCDGEAFVSPSGGTSPYSYLWSTSATNDTIRNLCAGNYFVTITDANSCSIIESVVVNEPLALAASTSTTPSTCNVCDGIASVSPTGAGPFTFDWFDNNLSPLGVNTAIAINLCSGNYFVDVTDQTTGCTNRFSASISDIGGETVVISQTDENCTGSCDGSATATFNCSTANCFVEWFDASTGLGIGQNTPTAVGLCAGNYFVEVTNDSGCISIEPVSINSPSIIFANATSIDATCANTCDGSASVAPTGGSGTYSFVWTPAPGSGQGTANASGMCPGNYTIEIIDGNGCSLIENITIGSPVALSATFTSIEPGCGLSNGSISSIINGGTAPYNFQWFDASNTLLTGQTSSSINSITAGSYTLKVTDLNGCEDFFSFNLSNGNGPTITLDSLTNLTCAGDNNGAIFITPSAGTAPYTFNWLPFGQTFEDLNGLQAGNYTVEVTDANGCISFETYTITEPARMLASFSLSDANCGVCDGTAEMTMTGGVAPYSYRWSNGSDSTRAVDLCAGIYAVEVIDGNGCEETFNVAINNLGGITNLVASTTDATCNSSCDGTATLNVIGGVAPYNFYWPHNGSTASSLTNLCAGNYFAQVTDANGCMRVTNITIGEPTKWTVNPSITAVNCNSFPCDGSILLNVTGGTAPYNYNWGPITLADTNYVDGLCAGKYTVDISDAGGCSQTFEFTVSNTAIQIDPTPTATDVSCFGSCDGTLLANISSTVIDYQWLDANNSAVAAPNTDAQGLCAGIYTLQLTSITDGCQYFENITINSPDPLTLTQPLVSNVNCANDCDGQISVNAFGGKLAYNFIWNDPNAQTSNVASGLCAGNYSAIVTDNNGCTAVINATVNAQSSITVSVIDTTNVGCSSVCEGAAEIEVNGGIAPYTITWQGGQSGLIATGLCFGPNLVTITDASNCSITETVFIGARDTVIALVGNDTVLCDNGTAVLKGATLGSGVTGAQWYNVPSYTLLTTALDTSFSIDSKGVYQYALIATNGLGCNDTTIKTITVSASPLIDAGRNVRIFDDEIAQLNPLGGQPSFTYLWTPSTNLSDPTAERPTSDTRESRTYTLTVTDTNGCTGFDTMRVLYQEPITFPSGFTPNGDGKNDVWNLDFIEAFPNTSVQVFNRWGQVVFEAGKYTTPWDGSYDGKAIPSGTYYYIIDLKDDKFEPFTGPITIMR